MKFIFLGAPGAGKGTQAEQVCQKYHIPVISTGNILRAALKSGTEMGLRAKVFMEKGELVPDEVLIGIIKDRIAQKDCAKGFILDGFPRTIPQAEALDNMNVAIDRVINIDVPDKAIVQRMSGRRVCDSCGASYHISDKQPKVQGVCDACGGTLIQRKDDQPETVEERLRVYHEQTEPLKNYYEEKGTLTTVKGEGTVEEITGRIFSVLDADASSAPAKG